MLQSVYHIVGAKSIAHFYYNLSNNYILWLFRHVHNDIWHFIVFYHKRDEILTNLYRSSYILLKYFHSILFPEWVKIDDFRPPLYDRSLAIFLLLPFVWYFCVNTVSAFFQDRLVTTTTTTTTIVTTTHSTNNSNSYNNSSTNNSNSYNNSSTNNSNSYNNSSTNSGNNYYRTSW